MKPNQIRLTRRAAIPITSSVVLLIAGTLSSLAQAAPPEQQGPNSTITYSLGSDLPGFTLCPGEKRQITISVLRYITPVGSPDPVVSGVANARFVGDTDHHDVAEVVDPGIGNYGVTRADAFQPFPRAKATIEGNEPGWAAADFELTPDVDPVTGITMRANRLRVIIHVVPCYEAYAGTLMNVFTQKDVCTMYQEFKVAGSGGPFFNVTAVFTPNLSSQFLGGDYILAGHVQGGTETSRGQWEVLAPDGSTTDDFLEIHLNGIGILVYDNGITVSDPNPTESVYILEIRLASPHLCPGT